MCRGTSILQGYPFFDQLHPTNLQDRACRFELADSNSCVLHKIGSVAGITYTCTYICIDTYMYTHVHIYVWIHIRIFFLLQNSRCAVVHWIHLETCLLYPTLFTYPVSSLSGVSACASLAVYRSEKSSRYTLSYFSCNKFSVCLWFYSFNFAPLFL